MSKTFPDTGEWPCFRRDGSQQAHSNLKGSISSPTIQWRHFIGTIDSILTVKTGEADDSIRLPLKQISETHLEYDAQRWGTSQPFGLLEGKMQPIRRGSLTEYADILPDYPGLEKVEFESGFNKPMSNGQYKTCVGRCFAWKKDQWIQVWETEPIEMLFHPLPITGDFDNDGHLEIAILPWYELIIFDAATGKIKDRCKFTDGRSYGFFGVYDLDGDGKSEFVVQADFAKHIDVLGYKDGKLSLLWRKEIELGFDDPQKILAVKSDPVADVDGDGKLEVIANLYNDKNDHRWHIIVHDGMTGEIKADLTDQYLSGLADVNGDGITEFLTTHTSGSRIPDYGPISVQSFKGGNAVHRLWTCTDAGWQEWERPLPRHINSTATLGQRDVLVRQTENGCYAVLRQWKSRESDSSEPALILTEWKPEGFITNTTVSGSSPVGLALDGQGNMLLQCSSDPTKGSKALITKGTGETLTSQRRSPDPGPVIAAKDRNDRSMMIVVQGAGEEMVAVNVPSDGHPATERWRMHGRIQCTAWPWQLWGAVAVDLHGDGHRQLIYATASPEGCARLVVANLDGKELWHHDEPRIPGGPPVWNTGALIRWQVGHFTDHHTQDVLVTVRRSVMHSDETMLLSGRDGSLIWHRDHEISGRGVGGGCAFAIADFNGDGYDDAASLYPSIFFILDGCTGKDILAKVCSWPIVDHDIYWGLPVAGDFQASGKADVFFASGGTITALLHPDGSMVWSDAIDNSAKGYPAFGDFDGDGRMEAIGIGYPDDGIRCYDTATGDVKWRMQSPAVGDAAGTASADLNSDGKDEAIFVIGKTLYCVGTDKTGKEGIVLWHMEIPAIAGTPSIADLDGTGKASIFLVGSDGYLYSIR